MGWNLVDAFAGGLEGVGKGLSSIGDSMDKNDQMNRQSRLLQQREEAMARLNNQLAMNRDQATYDRAAPDRAFEQNLKTGEAARASKMTDAQITNMQDQRTAQDRQLTETNRHNLATESNAANNTEARITIAEMNAENRRMASALRDAEKAAQLPKEQIEYLKGFSASRTKILSDTLTPDAEKKKALAALDADLYSNFPPRVEMNDSGQFRTRDVLGRTHVFANAKELEAAGFAAPAGAQPAATTDEPQAKAPKASAVQPPSQSTIARANAGDQKAKQLVQAWQDDQDAKRRMSGTRSLREADYADEEMSRAARPAFNLFPSP